MTRLRIVGPLMGLLLTYGSVAPLATPGAAPSRPEPAPKMARAGAGCCAEAACCADGTRCATGACGADEAGAAGHRAADRNTPSLAPACGGHDAAVPSISPDPVTQVACAVVPRARTCRGRTRISSQETRPQRQEPNDPPPRA